MNKISILLSVKPVFASKIFSGEKTIELRRKLPKLLKKGDLVIVYVSSPKKVISGAFTVKKIIEETPVRLWEIVSKKASVSREEFDKYFYQVDLGFGIVIDQFWIFTNPISVERMNGHVEKFNIPQSFRYLNEKENNIVLIENQAILNSV